MQTCGNGSVESVPDRRHRNPLRTGMQLHADVDTTRLGRLVAWRGGSRMPCHCQASILRH